MIRIQISEDAKEILRQQLAAAAIAQAGVFIYPHPKTGDVHRGEDGQVVWRFDRPQTWGLNIMPFENMPPEKIVNVDGIPIYASPPHDPDQVCGVSVHARHGEVIIEPIPATKLG